MKTQPPGRLARLLVALSPLALLPATSLPAKGSAWPAEVEAALARAGANRPQLVKALEAVPADQRKGMAFLIANMPDRDLKALRADFLVENVRLAYQARKEAPWGGAVPEEVFLNDVLPYANADEARHPWRKQLHELCRPLVKDCKTPAEAAQRLNGTIFPKFKVRYSTRRRKANQSPRESMASGLASCTGLSILLIDACRSVGVPARLVGTPMWANNRGNHTWVEVWDNGWHFAGAAEPDPKGLDRAWFVHDASQATKRSRRYAIYAASFRKTNLTFPLVWAPGRKDVFAEDVTDRYAKPAAGKKDQTRVLVRVWQQGRKKRLAVPVTVVDRRDAARQYRGESSGERADTNDILAFELPRGRDFLLRVGSPSRLEKVFRTTAGTEQLLEVEVPAAQTGEPAAQGGLSEEELRQVEQAARAYFAAAEGKRSGWKFDAALDRLLAGHEAAVRRMVWKAYRDAPIHADVKKDFDNNQVRTAECRSPYAVRKVGKRPAGGWPLVIAMHGGGGVPKEINDRQWKAMQRYYRDQDSVPGYLYLALRAPNDRWNGFYDDYVPPLVSNLIRQFLLFGDVNPNKVYLMGYSHGGYGAFFIGPKIPDRFAAVHASAAAPTDGTISARTLRNTRFTFMVGEFDNAYGRRERCERFNKEVAKLKKENPGDFPVEMEFKKGHAHVGLPDRDKIKDLYRFTRNPVPRHLTWDLTDPVLRHFYWLTVPKPAKGESIDATLRHNTVRVTSRGVKEFDLYLDGRLVDLGRPLKVVCDGKTEVSKARPRFKTLCQTLIERGDPELAFTVRVRLTPGEK